jgi:hypothetical protein
MGGFVGIALNRASGNRIFHNTIRGITLQDPSPGEANGAGFWLSLGSDANMIAGNTFDDIASYPIVLEGDSNRVELRTASDEVRDLGTGNRVGTVGIGAAQPGASPTPPVGYGRGRSIREQVRPGPRHPDALPRLRGLRTAGDLRSQESR